MEPARPLDTLNKARNQSVIVELKNGRQYIGKLISFDIHINTVLEDAEERVPEVTEKEVEGKTVTERNMVLKRKLGSVFIRGDTITIISAQ